MIERGNKKSKRLREGGKRRRERGREGQVR